MAISFFLDLQDFFSKKRILQLSRKNVLLLKLAIFCIFDPQFNWNSYQIFSMLKEPRSRLQEIDSASLRGPVRQIGL